MSKSFSSFEVTSLFSCLNAHGMTTSCELAAIRMASAALWCPTDPAWLLRESNLKFTQPPETNAEDESDKLGLSSHTKQNIAPSLWYTQGKSVLHNGKNFRFDWGTLPSSLGLLWTFSVFFSDFFSFPPTRYTLISIIASSQVNASLCSLQYAFNEELTSTKFSRPWFSQNRRQNFGNGTSGELSFLSKHRFTIFTNKIILSTLTLNVANIGIDVIII